MAIPKVFLEHIYFERSVLENNVRSRGGLLSSIFSKNPLKCLKTAISVSFRPFGGFRGKIAVLRHLEGFFEKSEESRPPLKLKNNGGLLSDIFIRRLQS